MLDLSIVVPIYNEEKTVPAYMETVRPIVEGITENYEIIFAMDPSGDRTEEIVLAEREKNKRVKLLKFSRRFGQPAATWAGLAYSTGRAAVVMDGDLQDPPSLIPEMYRVWKEEGYKVVIPQRISREGENVLKKATAYIGYWLINKTAVVEIPRNAGDFRLMDRRVVDELLKLNESHGYIRGLTAVVGFKTKLLPFDRLARHDGRTKYNPFTGSVLIAFNGIVAFSGALLRYTGIAGFCMAALSIFAAIFLFLGKAFHFYDFATGLATLGVLLLFLTGCQLVGMGILGAYIGRIYEETKMRPKFIVDEAWGFEDREEKKPGGGKAPS